MAVADIKQTSTIHTNEYKGFLSDLYKDPYLEAQTIQTKKKRK